MMPFFFPDRAPDANATAGDRTNEDGGSGVLAVSSKNDSIPVATDHAAPPRTERLLDTAAGIVPCPFSRISFLLKFIEVDSEIGQADLTVDDVLSTYGEGQEVELVIPHDSSGTAAISL
ncbi:unnamed protein product [Dibothriocephalus latus]|uniref:Uncharacterized protein n=1 Tax=Dibothriocephalus latus TaxID=60516 RepID=A0A3P7SDI4_DIBLA|nr:unnamed protein product [Dibothriocephalus latus]